MIDATASTAVKVAGSSTLSRSERLRRWQYRHRHAVEGWAILTPILFYYSIFFLIPVFGSLALSFTKWSGLSGSPEWVGLKNYERFITDPTYRTIITNTVVFAISILLVQTFLGMLIALLLNVKINGRGVFRAAWYIPTLTSAAVMAQVAFVFISPADGVINMVLRELKLPPIIFYTQVDWMRVIIIAYSVWRGVGGVMVLYLAALQGIHQELYEAAQVDGANGKQMFRYITVPLLAPMTIFVLITGIIGTAQIFEAVMFLSKGGPANLTNVLMLQIYQDAFANQTLGLASAGAIFLGLMLL
ncbi:MAG TPA: sugar ABC transporter permease, partial [Anaerolineae bacterium]